MEKKELLDTDTIKVIEDRITQNISKEVIELRQKIQEVDAKTQRDISRIETRLDAKLDQIESQTENNSIILAEIKALLYSAESREKAILSKQETIDKEFDSLQLEVALMKSNAKALNDDIHGSPERPTAPSIMALLKEMNNKSDDIISMVALHGEEIQEIQVYVKKFESAQDSVKRVGVNVIKGVFTRYGMILMFVLLMAGAVIFSPESVELLVRIIESLLSPIP